MAILILQHQEFLVMVIYLNHFVGIQTKSYNLDPLTQTQHPFLRVIRVPRVAPCPTGSMCSHVAVAQMDMCSISLMEVQTAFPIQYARSVFRLVFSHGQPSG